MLVPRIPELDPREQKSGPGILCEHSMSAPAPRTGQDDSKTKLSVDGIEVHGSGTTF